MIQDKNSSPASQMGGDMVIHNVGISNRIEDQLMIMNVLSNTLYTDKVAAVLREYGCNAADANVEAGRGDTPIQVRLPNRFDPTVSIRDYGFGMTEEQILNTFIMLGRSTKRSSNEFTGMLGIGSKAGFAYGDSFLVTSYTSRQMTVYNLFRDQGQPKLAKMHTSATDEPDGVEIKVPVRTEHTQEFVDKAQLIFSYFKVQPTVVGANIAWIDREVEHSGEGWAYTGNSMSVAIMGNVAYKLDAAAMGWVSNQYSGISGTCKEEALIRLGVELRFNIGDVDIAANREGLQYSDKTKAAVRQLLHTALQEISKAFSDQLQNCKTIWEAKQFYTKHFGRLDRYASVSLKQLIGTQLTWKGKSIGSGEMCFEKGVPEVGKTVNIYKRGGRYGRRGVSIFHAVHTRNLEIGENDVTIILNDLGKQSPARLNQWFTSNPTVNFVVVLGFGSEQMKKDYIKDYDLTGAPMTLLSSITPLVAATVGGGTSAHNSKHSAKVFVLDETFVRPISYQYTARSLWWKPESADLKKDTGVYVHIDAFRVKVPNPPFPTEEEPSEFLKKVLLLRAAGLITTPVFGMKSDRLDKLGKGWVKLEDHIKAQLEKMAASGKLAQEIADSLAEQAYRPWLMPESALPSIPKGTPMHTLLTEAKRMANPKSSKELRRLLYSEKARPWLETPTLPVPSFDLKVQESLVMQAYPILSLIPRSELECAVDTELKIIIDTIRLVESV